MANIPNADLSRADINDQVRRDADAMRKLRQLMGYVENSSETTVKLFQDDATKTYVVKVGVESKFSKAPRSYYGTSLNAAIQAAIDAGEGAE